jgi:chromosome segregation ATPase
MKRNLTQLSLPRVGYPPPPVSWDLLLHTLDKIVASINELKSQVNNTKEFLAATSRNQASTILNIQKVAEANMELAKKFTEATDKIATLESDPHQLSSST